MTFQIRDTVASDLEALLALYPRAFPDEDLLTLVRGLHGRQDVLALSAFQDGDLTGHVALTLAGDVALLGPLAVSPSHQRRGIGTALIREAADRLAAGPIRQITLLGDPAYYARHGFVQETQVKPPYPLPDTWAPAWQSIVLEGKTPAPAGRLVLPEPWMVPSYWG
ncbi:GNAT family N-acetyltransferase [Roseobacteraceae bacterium S113]